MSPEDIELPSFHQASFQTYPPDNQISMPSFSELSGGGSTTPTFKTLTIDDGEDY